MFGILCSSPTSPPQRRRIDPRIHSSLDSPTQKRAFFHGHGRLRFQVRFFSVWLPRKCFRLRVFFFCFFFRLIFVLELDFLENSLIKLSTGNRGKKFFLISILRVFVFFKSEFDFDFCLSNEATVIQIMLRLL